MNEWVNSSVDCIDKEILFIIIMMIIISFISYIHTYLEDEILIKLLWFPFPV